MVDIVASEESIIFDFQSVTSLGPGGKVTGLEAVMQVQYIKFTIYNIPTRLHIFLRYSSDTWQVLHIILTDFIYESDAFERAKQVRSVYVNK